MATVIACGNPSNESDSVKGDAASDKYDDTRGSSVAGAESHPLATLPSRDTDVLGSSKEIENCFRLKISFNDHRVEDDFKGDLSVTNNCDTSVAVLTSPVEVYVRLDDDDFFVEPTITIPVYAALYIFNAELGFGRDAFLGEGGREVHRFPGYATIPAHSQKTVEILGRHLHANLPAGSYGASFVTLAAPTSQASKEVRFIDLGQSVSRHNSETKEVRPLVRHPHAKEFSATTSFKVLKSAGAATGHVAEEDIP